MSVTRVALADHLFTVSGSGYSPEGTFTLDDKEISPKDYPELIDLTRAGLLCSEAELRKDDEEWTIERTAFSVSGLLGNRKVLLAVGLLVLLQLAFTYWAPAQHVFETGAIAPLHWLWILAAGIAVFVIVELEKAVIRRWKTGAD